MEGAGKLGVIQWETAGSKVFGANLILRLSYNDLFRYRYFDIELITLGVRIETDLCKN